MEMAIATGVLSPNWGSPAQCAAPRQMLARGAKKGAHHVYDSKSAIAVIGIDIGWSRVPPLSQGQLNVFLAQKDLSEPLMIIEPEISL
jgi:hypothetical protein